MRTLLIAALLLVPSPLRSQREPQRIARATGAAIVLLDAGSGAPLAVIGPQTPVLPGSVLKPLLLAAALRSGLVHASDRIACPGHLTVTGRDLTCTHPRSFSVLDAREALAYSCNAWFANLGRRFTGVELQQALRSYGLTVAVPPSTPESHVLLTLGLEGIETTPSQLATAYLRLARQLNDPQLVSDRQGLLDSVSFGMAHAAALSGLQLAGKTGTASQAPGLPSHGWFCGILFDPATGAPTRILIVYLPRGTGNDAAALAARILRAQP